MASFKTLTFKTIERNRRESEITARRQKLIVKLEEQQKVLEHYLKGEQYTVTRPKWMQNNHGKRVLVQKQHIIRPWFFERGRGYYLQVKYGTRILSVDGVHNAIFVEAISDLKGVLSELIAATQASELDDAIAQALKPQPKYKPGAAKSADIHRLMR
ncbi:hypothetical protein OAO92_09730 [Paracoccaceae bacterium]|jgi:hypothetical protein|nr:hypothetical protein [Paracoccaceae bacterium]